MNVSLLYNLFMGETSPLIAARIDSPAHQMGAQLMKNMIPMLTGGLRKRPGTWYDGNTSSNKEARLIDWLLSDGTCIILEITAGMIQGRGDTQFQVTQQITNSYTGGQISGLQYAATANTMWIVHPDQPVLKLEWNGSTVFKTTPTFTGKDFNSNNNYPGAIAFNAGRLCFAGTKSQPNRIYMSKAPNSLTGEDRYTDFTAGENPADSIVIEENDMHGSRIQWLGANRYFLAGTERATWSDTGEVPTPATFDMHIVEYAGSGSLQARGSREIMIYAGRNGRTLRALVWNENAQGFVDMDISEQATHLFGSGIKDFAVADFPDPMIWIVTQAGDLISCTINVRGGMLAYAHHITDGKIEAVAVAPQKTGDLIFLSVLRGEERNIEHIILEDLVNDNFEDSHYVDAGEKRTFTTPTSTITGLQRFAGKKVNIFADGAIEPSVMVEEDGTIELQSNVSEVHLGLPFISFFRPNERQIPANGTSLGKKRRLEKITLRMFRSLGGRAGTAEEKTTALITERFGSYVLGTAPQPFTGEIDVTVSGNIDTEGKLVVIHEEPVPFTMLALVERVAILEG